MSVLPTCAFMCRTYVQCLWWPEEGTGSPELELQMVVNYYVGARTHQTWVLCKSNQPVLSMAEPSFQPHKGVF